MKPIQRGDRVCYIPDGRTGIVSSFNKKNASRCFVLWDETNTESGVHIAFLSSQNDELEKLQIKTDTYEPPDMLDNIII